MLAVEAWCEREHAREGGGGGAAGVEERFPTGEELDEFLDECARACPLAWVTLLWMRLHEAVMKAEETEGENDWETWTELMTIFQELFCVTNATFYARMMGFEMWEWAKACKAAREVHKKWGFTQETKHGKRVWSDRLVEWTVRTARARLGQRAGAGHEKEVKRTFFTLEERADARSRAQKGVSSRETHDLVLTEVFAKVYAGVKHVRIFATEGNIHPLGITDEGGMARGAYVGINGEPLSADFFRVMEMGKTRAATINESISKGFMPPPSGVSWVRALQRDKDVNELAEWVKDYSSVAIELSKSAIKADECKDILRAAKAGPNAKVRELFTKSGYKGRKCALSGNREVLVGFVSEVRKLEGEDGLAVPARPDEPGGARKNKKAPAKKVREQEELGEGTPRMQNKLLAHRIR